MYNKNSSVYDYYNKELDLPVKSNLSNVEIFIKIILNISRLLFIPFKGTMRITCRLIFYEIRVTLQSI